MGQGKKVLIDTSILIEALDKEKVEILPEEPYISVITVYEYIRYKKDRRFFKKMLEEAFNVVGIDNEVLLKAAEMFSILKEKGMAVSENDVYIAATAIVHGFELWSKDRDFERVLQCFPELMLKLETSDNP